jgi:hypothetical protein
MKQVLVTTAHRGVFAGECADDTDFSADTISLVGAKMAIHWGTTKGLMELAHTGPTSSSRISAPADIPELKAVTAIFLITPKAWKVWLGA